MSAPTGSAASSWTSQRPQQSDAPQADSRRPRSRYSQRLALRREAAAIRRQTGYGLVMGWILLLVPGFIYFCVPSRLDWLWAVLSTLGGLHLAAAVILPQALAWPERAWMAVARWQGWLVMTVLLTIVYYGLIWPAARWSRHTTRGFVSWDDEPPPPISAWEITDLADLGDDDVLRERYRSLPVLLASVIGFFIRRRNYVLLPILILLIVLGLALYFAQSSVVAPFIYTLF
jgi:hypothetical protein